MADQNCFDFAFIGAGIATVFALQRISEKVTNKKSVIIDVGRPPMKRKHQMTGWMGAVPSSDAKLYIQNKELENLIGNVSYEKHKDIIISYLKDKEAISDLFKSNLPKSFLDKISKFELDVFDYYQMYPKNIHMLSKIMSSEVIDDKRFQFQFDEEVINIEKEKNCYKITTQPMMQSKFDEIKTYYAKSIVLASGRTSISWNNEVLSMFNKIEKSNIIQYGIKVEISDKIFGDLNKSIFTLSDKDLLFGKFIWNGTMIPEDRFDYVLSSVRTNESRWESDKVHFDILRTVEHENATKELERIANLSFIMANERVIKESLKSIIAGKSKLSILNEYGTKGKSWLVDAINKLESIFPGIISTGKFYYPTIVSSNTYKINLDSKLCLGDDIYVIGEATGIPGILQAAIMGNYFADKNF
jgi:uncharacterized FAD-dependent dehydrogenase